MKKKKKYQSGGSSGGWMPTPYVPGNNAQWGPWLQSQVDAGTSTGQTFDLIKDSPFAGLWTHTAGNFNKTLQSTFSPDTTGSGGKKYSAYTSAQDYARDSMNDNVRRSFEEQAKREQELISEYEGYQSGKKNMGNVANVFGPLSALWQGEQGYQNYLRKPQVNLNAEQGFFGFKKGGVTGYITGQPFKKKIPRIPAMKQEGGPLYNGIVNTTGYLPGTPSFNNPFNVIPSNNITMQNVPFNILGISNNGKSKMMMPGRNYKFPGAKSVLEIPLAQYGGQQPTQQDSLDLYNNTNELLNFYKKNNYREFITKSYASKKNDLEALDYFKGKKNSMGEIDNNGDEIATTDGDLIKRNFNDYYQHIDKNKYKIRELAFNVLNMGAPMQLKDWRISPEANVDFSKAGDYANVNLYDPIRIKPYSMLTPEEKKIRDSGGGQFFPAGTFSSNKTKNINSSSILKRYKRVKNLSGLDDVVNEKNSNYKFQPIPGNDQISTEAPENIQYFYNDTQMGEPVYHKKLKEFPTKPTRKRLGGKIR